MTAQEYLKQHGITQTIADTFNLSHDKEFLHIPVKDEEGNLLFVKSRNLKEDGGPKYKNSAGSHAVLFNLHAVKDMPNIVLCEGEIDCIRLTQGGIPSVSSTGGSQTFNPEWAAHFKDKNTWVVYDNDDAGKKGIRQVLQLIPHARVITLPEDSKDVSEYLLAHSKKDFVQLMRNALTKQEWEAANIPEDYSILSPLDYETMPEDLKPWLVDNIVYSEGFCFIYGTEGVGKSFLTLDIAKAVAQGEPWMGKFKTSKTSVLFLDKENPHSITKRRIAGLGINSTDTPNIYWLKYPEKFCFAGDRGGYSDFAVALTNTIASKQIGLIIFDSFVDFMVGNESSSGDTQAFFDSIRELYPRIAYISLHHENKPSQGVLRSDSQRLRGSSNINAQTVTMFRLEQVVKSKTEMTLKQTKSKDAQKLDKFMIRMNVKKNMDETTTVTGFTYIGDVIEGPEDESKAVEVENIIQEMLSNEQFVGRTQIKEMILGKGYSERTIDSVLKKMVERGQINPIKKGKEKWFTSGMFSQISEDILEDFDGTNDL